MAIPLAIFAKDKKAKCNEIPSYTAEANAAHVEGTVILQVTVSDSGKVVGTSVRKKLGYGLDRIATETIKCWKFEPAMKDGHPVAVQVLVEVPFRWPDGLVKDKIANGH